MQGQARSKDVLAAGGLCVIGTERHESRRIDNQLRGRSGRQGDPGETQFYLSLEDDLMRLFGDSAWTASRMMEKPTCLTTCPSRHLFPRQSRTAQRKVESLNFAMRKQRS